MLLLLYATTKHLMLIAPCNGADAKIIQPVHPGDFIQAVVVAV
jgi:hypothetical protein